MTRLSLVLPVVLAAATTAAAAPPADTLLPASTPLFVATADAAGLWDAWGRTQFGRALADPAFRPYLDDLDRAGLGLVVLDRLGLTPEQIRPAAGGPGAVAVVARPGGAALVAFLDTTGKAVERAALLKRADETVRAGQGQVGRATVAATAVTVYTLPAAAGRPAATVYQIVKDDLLVLTDDPKVLDGVLARWAGSPDALAAHAPYVDVLARTTFPDGRPAHLSWFADPFGLADALRAGEPKPKKNDPVETLRQEGFTAVKGVGGRVRLDDGPHDLVYRTAVHARGPFQRAARMLSFPADPAAAPAAWVPADVTRYMAFRWDLTQAFAGAGNLVDRLTGQEGDFEDVIKGLKQDKDGPQVDVVKDVVGRLTGRVTVIADCPDPVPAGGERTLVGFEARDAAELAKAVAALVAGDARLRKVQGVDVWELTSRQKKPAAGGKPIEIPPVAIAVAHGTLFVSEHPGLLDKVLGAATAAAPLAADPGFARALADLGKLDGGGSCRRVYARPREAVRGPYELARAKHPAAGGSLTVLVLRAVLGGDREQGADPAKLPAYDKVAPYLGDLASSAVPVRDGWDLVGVVYKAAKP